MHKDVSKVHWPKNKHPHPKPKPLFYRCTQDITISWGVHGHLSGLAHILFTLRVLCQSSALGSVMSGICVYASVFLGEAVQAQRGGDLPQTMYP